MSEGTKVALIVGGVVGALGLVAIVLLLVVPLLLGAFFVSHLDDIFEEYSPKAVPVGKAFHWNDADYAAGWQVSQEAGDRLRPTGLTLMSSDDAFESPPETYAIAFVRDGVVVAQASCETEDSIEPGTGNTLRCEPTHDVVGEYDELVIGYPEDLVNGESWDPFPDESH